MKVLNIRAFSLVVFLVAVVSADTEDKATQQFDDDAIQEIQTKEASVRAARAKFNKAQELFDAAAAELQEAHDKLQQVSAKNQFSQDHFADVFILTRELTDQITPLTLNLVNDAALWHFQSSNASVIGVALEDAAERGVLIKGVLGTSPADMAGIEAGDIILSVNDIDITEHDNPTESAIELINSHQPGTVIQLSIQRHDKELAMDVATIARSSMNRIRSSGGEWQALEGVTIIEKTEMDPRLWNIVTTALPGAEKKVYVMEIEEDFGSYFDVDYGILVVKAPDVDSIQAGDILLEIDDKPIRSISQAFQHKHNAEDDVGLRIKRKKKEENISLERDQFSLHAILE